MNDYIDDHWWEGKPKQLKLNCGEIKPIQYGRKRIN